MKVRWIDDQTVSVTSETGDVYEVIGFREHRLNPREVRRQRHRFSVGWRWCVLWLEAWFGRGPWQPPLTRAEEDVVHRYLAEKYGVKWDVDG